MNGISTSGVGQQGLSDSGIGTLGTHGETTGISPGVQGETNSTDPAGAGVVGKNNGGGPGLKAVVNPGAPPLAVNSQVRITSLNADKLDDLDSAALQKRVTGACAAGSAIKVVNADGSVACEPVGGGGVWGFAGNSGTTPGTNFLGTSDNQALELKVNGQRALRIEPDPTSPNLIGGFAGNYVYRSVGATIGGGGGPGFGLSGVNSIENDMSTVGGGWDNLVGAESAVVAGGASNFASANVSTIAGGRNNTDEGSYSAVGGGSGNSVGLRPDATVAGGSSNQAIDYASTVAGGYFGFAGSPYDTVVGGAGNETVFDYSLAAGNGASADKSGSFVFADHTGGVAAPAANTFTVRASGGIWLGTTSSPSITAGHFIDTSTGGFLSSAGAWTNASDRALKQDFRSLDKQSMLDKVARIPISSWSYKAENSSVRHIGPMAQDFDAAFRVGLDDKHITSIDEHGVALAAIQRLYRENRLLERRVRRLERELHIRHHASEGGGER
jgi:hypothetical protein